MDRSIRTLSQPHQTSRLHTICGARVPLFDNPMLFLVFLARACVGSHAEREEVFSFGNTTELFTPGKIENPFFSVNVIRTIFSGEYHGATTYLISEGVLSFDIEVPDIEEGFVFIEKVQLKLFEVKQVLTNSSFQVEEIDPLGVFTKLRLSSSFLKQPNLFEGFANLEVSGLDFASFECETRTFDDTSFTYQGRKGKETLADVHFSVFSLKVSIMDYTFELNIDFSRRLQTLANSTEFAIEYTRDFHNEIVTGASMCSLKSNISEIASANSYPEQSYFVYDPKTELKKGCLSFNATFTNNVTVSMRIANVVTSHSILAAYHIANKIVIGDESTVSYNVSMSYYRQFTDFVIHNRSLWKKEVFPVRMVDVPYFVSRKELLYNETLYEPECQDVGDNDGQIVIVPYNIFCNASTSLLLRIDVYLGDRIRDSLLLEPIQFDHDEVEQHRILTLQKYRPDYVFRIFVRDIDREEAEYMNDSFTINDTSTVLRDPRFDLTVRVNISTAYQVKHSTFYRRPPNVDYVYFKPDKGQYSVIRRSSPYFLTCQERDILRHEAFMLAHDPTLFWDVSTFQLVFTKLVLSNTTRSLRLTFNVQMDTSRMEPFYDSVFTQNITEKSNDRLLFQMNENWALRLYATWQSEKNETRKVMFKESFNKLVEQMGKSISFSMFNCTVDLNLSRKTLQPILHVSKLEKFAIAPTYIMQDNITIPKKGAYSILRYTMPPVSDFEELQNIHAIMRASNVTVLSQNFLTDNQSLVIKLTSGVNIRSIATSVIISLPIYSHSEGFLTCRSPMVLTMPKTIFCRQRAAVNGSSSCPLGCLEHGHSFGIQLSQPQELQFESQRQALGALVSISYITAKAPEPTSIVSYLNDVWQFPELATELYGDFDDTVFKNFRVQCSKCKTILVNHSTEHSPVANTDMWIFPVPTDPITLAATCSKDAVPFCVRKHKQEGISLLEFTFPYGITSYTPAIPLESSVIFQVVPKGTINYSQKWNGRVNQRSIVLKSTLSITIERKADSVVLTGALDDQTMPFSVVSIVSDPLRFLSELGLRYGYMTFEGRITAPAEDFSQPTLGQFHIKDYDRIDLPFVFGFNTSNLEWFEVKCAPSSPEVGGICKPSEVSPTATVTFSATGPVTESSSSSAATITAIIASTVCIVVVAAGSVAGYFIHRRMKQTAMTATGIMRKQTLLECEFDI